MFALYAWDVDALLQTLRQACSPGEPGEPGEARETRLEVLRVADAFTPGVFTRLRLRLYLPAAVFETPRRHLEQYLAEAYVPYSLRREEVSTAGATRYRFDIPAKGLKKKVLLGGHFEIDEAGFEVCLEVGPRFDLLALLERFGVANPAHYAKLGCADIRW